MTPGWASHQEGPHSQKHEAEKCEVAIEQKQRNKTKMIKRYYIDDLMWSSPSLDGGKTFPHQLISIPSNETIPQPKTQQEKVTWS